MRNGFRMAMAQTTDREDRDDYPFVTRRQVFTEDWMRRIAAMLGLPGLEWSIGDPVPFGWHFPLLGAETFRNNLRADGFPGLGISLPRLTGTKLTGQRLVAVGRTVNILSVLYIGQELERTSKIGSIVPKTTAQGPITLFSVEHSIRDFTAKTPIIVEKQTYILLDTPYTIAPPETVDLDAPPPIVKTVTPDETLLFQFSALSFNSHKIHLDRDFARTVEGYPDLVVNGGLTTLLMTEIVRSDFGNRIRQLTVRNRAPLFCNKPIHLARPKQDGQQIIVAMDDAGRAAAEMEFHTNDV